MRYYVICKVINNTFQQVTKQQRPRTEENELLCRNSLPTELYTEAAQLAGMNHTVSVCVPVYTHM